MWLVIQPCVGTVVAPLSRANFIPNWKESSSRRLCEARAVVPGEWVTRSRRYRDARVSHTGVVTARDVLLLSGVRGTEVVLHVRHHALLEPAGGRPAAVVGIVPAQPRFDPLGLVNHQDAPEPLVVLHHARDGKQVGNFRYVQLRGCRALLRAMLLGLGDGVREGPNAPPILSTTFRRGISSECCASKEMKDPSRIFVSCEPSAGAANARPAEAIAVCLSACRSMAVHARALKK